MKRTVTPMISMSLLVSLTALGCLGCAEPEPRPTPPDLSALVAAYAEPSGEVTRESARLLVADGARDLTLVSEAGPFVGLIEKMFTDLAGVGGQDNGLAAQKSGLTVSGVKVEAGGWIVYNRLCPRANGMGGRGTIRATALIDIDAFEPVIWGRLSDCRVDGSGIDGDLALHIDWVDGEPAGVIARINGLINLGGTAREGEFSVRWSGTTAMALTTLESFGSFLVGFDSGAGQLLIEGSNGRFVCNDTRCDGPDGGFAW